MSKIIVPNHQDPMRLRIDTEEHLGTLVLGLVASWAKDHDEYITRINLDVGKDGDKKVFKSINFEVED